MAKTYWFRFGSGDPRTYTGYTPTLIFFKNADGTDVSRPAISETPSTGMYYFSFGTTVPISFLADAATTAPGADGRYVVGTLDPADRADEYGNTLVSLGTSSIALGTTGVALGTTNVAIGTTNVAIGTSLLAQSNSLVVSLTGVVAGIGTTASSFGTVSTDPTSLFGYMKRVIENLEGDQSFDKSSGALTISDRASSVTLAVKTITNSITNVIKT
jgi:hypothetical protein